MKMITRNFYEVTADIVLRIVLGIVLWPLFGTAMTLKAFVESVLVSLLFIQGDDDEAAKILRHHFPPEGH